VQATGPLFGTMQALLLGAAAVGMGLKAGSYPHRVFPSSDAYTFYKISGAAYCNVTGWTCAPCLASNQSVLSTATFQGKKSDTRVFVAAYKDKITGHDSIVLSIRGTSSLTNWIENIKIAKTDREMSCAGCKVHAGFLDVWKPVQQLVFDEIIRLRHLYPGAELYVTGHSLGGAVAILAAYVLQYDLGQAINGVYTFGAPRVGNAAFADYYSNSQAHHVTWRLTHHRDPVPHLPMVSMGFQHSSTEVFYNENSTAYHVCDGSGEDPVCIDAMMGMSIYDHLHYFDEAIGNESCGPGMAIQDTWQNTWQDSPATDVTVETWSADPLQRPPQV